MYYVYKQFNGLPCVAEKEQMGMELIGTAETAENAEKMLKSYLLSLKYKNWSINNFPKFFSKNT